MAPRDFNEDLDDEGSQGQSDEDQGDEREEGGQEAASGAAGEPSEEEQAGAPDRSEDLDEPFEERPTRGQQRFQRLANRNAELERELEELRRQQQAPAAPRPPPFESDQDFASRVQHLPPDERLEARLARSEQINNFRMAQMSLQAQNFADKSAYDAKAATNRKYARYAAEVEKEWQKQLQAGMVVPREAILRYLIGGKVLDNADTPEMRRAQEANRKRVQRQETRPPAGRSDVQGGRRQLSERAARAKRLENVQI